MSRYLWDILLIDDDEEDYIITRDKLAEAQQGKFHLEWASDFEAGQRALSSKNFDAVLLDYDLGEKTGLDFLRATRVNEDQGPIILLTGQGSYELDLEAMKAGAADFLEKSQVTGLLLERAIRYAVESRATQKTILKAKENLEYRVEERTRELLIKNQKLNEEILERQRIEAELAEVQRRLIDNVEVQRLELAQEIHDGPIQDLYAINMQMDILRTGMVEKEKKELIVAANEKLKQVVHSLRTISGELRPPTLAPFGLEKAIRSHAQQIQAAQPDLEIYLDLTPDKKLIEERIRLALYRIYQSAFANVLRHAQASRVEIRLILNGEKVVLEIQDNGCGFDVPSRWLGFARKGHLGLLGASERAEAVDGKLEITSSPGKGTLVRVTAPMSTT
jgi:signal transduction histidine kinase